MLQLRCLFLAFLFSFFYYSPSIAATTCSAGYYLSNGVCNICPKGYYCSGGTKDKVACIDASYSDTAGATACKSCPTATKYKDLLYTYHYWSEDGLQDSIDGCHMFFNTTAVANGSVDSGAMLCYLGTDNDYGVSTRVCQVLTSKIKCNPGYWNNQNEQSYAFYSNYTEMLASICTPVGSGFYSPADKITRTACDVGESTLGYGQFADSADDCGRKLYVGDTVIQLHGNKRTAPSLAISVGDKIYYGNIDLTNSRGKLHLKHNGMTYSVYDETY